MLAVACQAIDFVSAYSLPLIQIKAVPFQGVVDKMLQSGNPSRRENGSQCSESPIFEVDPEAQKWSDFCSRARATGARPTFAQTLREAYIRECGGCHFSEKHLRRVPRGSADERRVWIEKFMMKHPNERDRYQSLIVDYIVSVTEPK